MLINRLRYLALVLTLSVLLTFYLTLLLTVPVNPVAKGTVNPKGRTKEVVAYSLRKRIEIESEEVFCGEVVGGAPGEASAEGLWTAVPGSNLLVFGVYYDDRLEPFRYVRLLGMIKGNSNKTFFCQIHLKNNTYHITKAVQTDIWLKEWHVGDNGTFNPVLLSCLLPSNSKPKTLSVSTSACKLNPRTFKIATPNLHETKANLSSKHFHMTVCVKPLNFAKDISKPLMQWIEINKLLGATKFEIFISRVPRKVRHLLEFYSWKDKGNFSVRRYENVEEFVEHKNLEGVSVAEEETNGVSSELQLDVSGSVKKERQNLSQTPSGDGGTVSYTEASGGKIWQKRRNEIITYNDCLYRNLRSSHFVIPVDIDEIIVPKRFYTWGDALGRLFASMPRLHEEFASFSARNAFFLEEFAATRPQEVAFFFEHYARTGFSEEGASGKSFVSTRNSLTVFNHYSLDVLKPGIARTYFLPLQLVQMNHYRRTCPFHLLPQCAKYLSSPVRIVDTVIDKYKVQFVRNYEKTVKAFRAFNSKRTVL